MGLVKARLEEQSSAGFSYSGSAAVCSGCITDEALARHVAEKGSQGPCDFCHDAAAPALALDALFVEMGQCIRSEFTPVSLSTEVPAREWEVDVPTASSSDLMELLDAPLGEGALAEAFIDAFDEEWVAEGVWAGTPEDWLTEGWEHFVHEVKTARRFVFLRPASRPDHFRSVDIDSSEMLDRLAGVIDRCNLVIPFPAGQRIYRARRHPPDMSLIGERELGAPPPEAAVAQRMNPAGIPVFYAAPDEATALAELRGVAGEHATVGEWVTTRDSYVLDLARLPELPSIFDRDEASLRPLVRFLERFAQEVGRPVRAHDAPAIDYVPTQIVAEYVRFFVRSRGGEAVAGIMYPSVARSGGTNIALFVDPAGEEIPGLRLVAACRFEVAHTARWRPLAESGPP